MILLDWNETAAHQRLLEKIKSDKELYDAVRASNLMEEMESKVEAYRQRMGG